MRTERSFRPADRYLFDYQLCKPSDGWAQVDTSQDASYHGTWANPFTLKVTTYLEGDIIRKSADSVEEFVSEIRSIKKWNEENGLRFMGIDALCKNNLIEKFKEVGLGDLLH